MTSHRPSSLIMQTHNQWQVSSSISFNIFVFKVVLVIKMSTVWMYYDV